MKETVSAILRLRALPRARSGLSTFAGLIHRYGRLGIALAALISCLALPNTAAAAPSVTCPIPGPAWKFLGDINFPDGTQVSPGQVINKGWKLQNCGTTDWSGFKAVRIAGSYGPSVIPLPNALSLQIFDLFQIMTVPSSPGLHRAEYKIQTDTGIMLVESFWVEVLVVGGTNFTLTIIKSGSGTVSSNPPGINCGATCSATFPQSTTVSLSAVPAPGFSFAGWSGDADCSNGVVVMSGNRTCRANFQPVSPNDAILTVATTGSGSGKVIGPGINCGAGATDCSQTFSPGTLVTLTPLPSAGSSFGGWIGDCDASGQVVMNGDRACWATFDAVSACTPGVSLQVSPTSMQLQDGWPAPNPVTVTMTVTSSGSCSGDAMLRIGTPGGAPRFFVYDAQPTGGCQVSVDDPAGFSTRSFLLNCPLSLGAGQSRIYTVNLWVQPSAGGAMPVQADWKGATRSASVFVPQAAIHPLVFLHGIQGAQPPQNRLITDQQTARSILDPFLGHYSPLLDQLQKMGYEWNKTLFAVAYDWRNDNRDSASFLASALAALPNTAGDGKADIIAHSMGGLVTRAYVQGPSYAGNVRKVIFVATPHKGFPFTYRTWEGLTWSDYVGHAPLGTGIVFQLITDRVLWPSHVAKKYNPSDLELLVCTFQATVFDSLPGPLIDPNAVVIFRGGPTAGFYICTLDHVYNWSHSSDPARAVGSLPQMLPTEDRRDYLFDPLFGSPRPFGYQPNQWLTDLNANISTLGARLGVDNIYNIVGNNAQTDERYTVLPPGYVFGSPMWRYGRVLPFPPFVQEQASGDNLIPLWSTGLGASGLLSLPPGHEIVMDASQPCGWIRCDTAIHSPIMYQDDTQTTHVPGFLAGVSLPFKTDYWPPVLDLGDPVAKILEVLSLVTACPIDLYIVDPFGRRLGRDPVTGQIHREIPNAVYTEPGVEPQAVLVPNPVPGTYQITATGYDNGPYSFRVDRTGGETANIKVFGGDITTGQTRTVTIDLAPNAAPIADAGADQVISAGADCSARVVLDGTGSSDPDGDTLQYTWTGPMGTLHGGNAIASLPPGQHTLTLTVHDGKGQTASDTVVITVQDVTPPIVQAPAPVTAEQASAAGTAVRLPPATATDNCGVPQLSSDAPAVFPLGTTTVTFTAVDAYGNVGTATTSVTVVDSRPPVLTNVPAAVRVEQATAAGTLVTLPMPAVTDICDAAPVLTTSHPTPAVFPLGTTKVTFTATDASGNVATATTMVTVVDTTPPVLSNVPPPVTVEQQDLKGTRVPLALPTATDVCDAAPKVTSNAPAVFPLGKTKVTFTAVDGSGNRARATTTVTVVDTTPPKINGITARPGVLWPPNHKLQPVVLTVSAEDICDARLSCKIVSVRSNQPVTGHGDRTSPDWVITGDLKVSLRAERAGAERVYTITVRCTDDSGNSSTRTVQVTVPHSGGSDREDGRGESGGDRRDEDPDAKRAEG